MSRLSRPSERGTANSKAISCHTQARRTMSWGSLYGWVSRLNGTRTYMGETALRELSCHQVHRSAVMQPSDILSPLTTSAELIAIHAERVNQIQRPILNREFQRRFSLHTNWLLLPLQASEPSSRDRFGTVRAVCVLEVLNR